MVSKKIELEGIIQDLEARIEEEEEMGVRYEDEKKKYQLNVNDLEEQ